MLEFMRVTRTSLGQRVRTVLATVLGFGMTGDDENAETHEDCEVVGQLGLVARPALGNGHDVEAVAFREGDEIVLLGFLHKTGDLHDAEPGETQLFSEKEPTCRIRLRANGTIEITAKSGQDIVLNGGSAKVGRVDDAVSSASTMSTWISEVTSYINGIAPGTLVLPTDFGTIAAGADNVKA